ncbi:MAG: hypothetical protein Q4F53_08700 [Nesterenkonia sp.]|nr:hypothetical protein [Nesterenkonia sp.]
MAIVSFAPGVMPGTDPSESARALEAELPAPHSPALPELPARGHAAGLMGRAAAMLPEMPTDLTSYGWRLASGPGADVRRASTLLRADVDALADVRGERLESGAAEASPPLTVFVLGPVSLCAALALPDGEKTLIDHGARRDVTESLADGVSELLARLRRTASPSQLRLVLLEPDHHRVRTGGVPTVSGYRSIRALPRDDARAMLGTVLAAVRAEGAAADEVLIDLGRAPEDEAVQDLLARSEARADGFVLPTTTMRPPDWERAAELTEAGARCAFSVLGAEDLGAQLLPEVSTLAERVAGPWQAMGMPLSSLDCLTLTAVGAEVVGRGGPVRGGLTRDGLARLSLVSALRTVTRVRDAAEALEDRRRQAS